WRRRKHNLQLQQGQRGKPSGRNSRTARHTSRTGHRGKVNRLLDREADIRPPRSCLTSIYTNCVSILCFLLTTKQSMLLAPSLPDFSRYSSREDTVMEDWEYLAQVTAAELGFEVVR